MSNSVGLENLFCICLLPWRWKRTFQKIWTFSAQTTTKNPSKFQGIQLTRFMKSKTLWGSIFFRLILISVMENSLVSLLVGEFNNVTKVSTFYVTRIRIPASATPTQSSKFFDAVLVTQSFERLVIQNGPWLLSVNETYTITQRAFTSWEGIPKIRCIQCPIKRWAKADQKIGKAWFQFRLSIGVEKDSCKESDTTKRIGNQ